VEFSGDLASLAAARFISPAVKTVMANLGVRSPSLFAKDAIRTAMTNKQTWPVIRRFLPGLGAGAAAEGAEEAVQEGISAQVEATMKNWLADAGMNYFREEQGGLLSGETWKQMAEAGLEGAKVGAWFVLLPGVAQLAVDSVRVSRAREFAQAAKDVSDTIAATQTKELSPTRMESFLKAQGLNQTVFLPADAAWQMQQSGVDIAAPLGWEQATLEEAAALGHDIAVPFARLEARLDPAVMKQVADIMKEGPEMPNAIMAEEPNLFLADDIEAIDSAVQEWEFEQNLLDFELERLRSDLTAAVRSVPNLLKDIVGSADTETSVGTYVDSIVRLVEKAAQRLRVYGDDMDSIISKLQIQGLVRDAQGRSRTPEEIEQMMAEIAEAQADAPFWENVWGRLDAASLKRDFPEARKELARQHGRGLFARKGEGIAVDELADILKNAGWLEQDADSSTLVEALKSKKSPKRSRGLGWAENFLRQVDTTPRASMDAVRKQYEGTDAWMKAPNGEPTNLTERQWIQVRTPEFKAWFGDWENDPENASKVVDENGEPKVVWHGTRDAGFDVFDTFGMGKTAGTGAWFAGTKQTASTYSGTRDEMEVLDEDGELVVEEGYANYPVFLNIRNPYSYPAGGRNWDSIGEVSIYDMEAEEYIYNYPDGIPFDFPYEDAAWMYVEDELGDPDHVRYEVHWSEDTTDSVTREVRSGYMGDEFDGVIIEDVQDSGGHGDSWPDTDYIVFDPEQIKSATHNVGTFDPRHESILYQSYTELNDVERIAVDAYLDAREDGADVRARLEKHRGTPWEKQTIESILIRVAMEDIFAGRPMSVESKLGAPSVRKFTELIQRKGVEGAWQYLRRNSIIGHASKAVNAINSSYVNCRCSDNCARYCYAAVGNYAFPVPAVKSELVSWAVETDPIQAADIAASEYKATIEFDAGKALRLFDKGDMSPQWIPFIKRLNEKGIRVQAFSKRPDLLRQLDFTKNVLMLSIDRSNLEMAAENPDLPIAFVYEGVDDLPFLEANRERFEKNGGVILPVIQGKKLLDDSDLKALPRWTRAFQCPVDNGIKEVQGKDNPTGWNCTKCDKNGGLGCFYGRTLMAYKKKEKSNGVPDEAGKREEAVSRIEADVRRALEGLSADERRRFLDQLVGVVHQIKRDGFGESEGRDPSEAGGVDGRESGGASVGDTLYQGQAAASASITPMESGEYAIQLFQGANLSSLMHEISHAVHLEMERLEQEGKATPALTRDLAALRNWTAVMDDDATLKAEYDRYQKSIYGVAFEELEAMDKLAVRQRAKREMVARGFEQYLREGEAPSAGMEGVFRRFKKWMMRVYRRAQMLNVELTDEVREVFSHLVASDEDIAAAAARSSVHDESAGVLDALGVQGAERLELEGMIADAKDKAADALRRSRAKYRRDHVQQWRDAVEHELEADPVYRVRKALRRTPIDFDSVVESYGQELADRLRLSLPASMKRGGDNPELLAFDYGFNNAGEMISAILNRPGTAERRKELLAQKRADADARYAAEDYLYEQDELAQQQDKIGEIVYRLELEGRTQGGKPVPVQGRERWKAAREQIKTIAEQYLDAKRAGEAVRPDIYRIAAARLIREERSAILAKDWGTALQANYKARLNLEIARQAAERRDMVEKLTARARRFLDSKTPDKGARFAVFALSQNVQLFEPTRRMVQNAADKGMEDIHDFLEAMRDQGYYTVDAEIPDSLFMTAPGPWRGLLWTELRPYLEAMTVTMHMEQAARKANSEAAKEAWRFEMDFIAASITSLYRRREPGPFAKKNAILDKLEMIHASHLKADTICRLLDGDKEFGPAWSAIILPINRATADRDLRLRDAQKQVQKIFGAYNAREWVDIRSKRFFVQALNSSLTKEQMLAMALNCGNASNKQRLMSGLGLSENQVQAVINELDERDVRFVQAVWDYLETFRKESFDVEEELTGVRPQAIEAQPVQTPYGELRGGYYPVVYDSERSSKPIDTESIGTLTGSMMPAVDHGSLKQRTATGLGTQLQFDLEAIPRHVVKTVHMLAFRKPVQRVARILNDPAVNKAIETSAGVHQAKALKSWLHYVAGERPGRNNWSRAVGMLRKNAALYAMGMKLTTILAQTTGLLAAVAEIGPRWVLSGIMRTYARGNPFVVYRETVALSPMMENRMRSVDRDLYELSTGLLDKGSSNRVLDPLVRFKAWQERNAYLPMGFVQMALCDLPTWQGAYAKAIQEGMNQEQAVLYADGVVERTQVGGADKDLAEVQRGEELGKIMTQFYSYFSALYQLYARRLTMARRRGSSEDMGRLATLFLLTGVLEPILSAVATRNTPDEGEDDLEDWLAWAGQKIFFNPFNMVIGLRDFTGAIESWLEGYGGKARAGSLLNDTIDAGTRFLRQLEKGMDMDAHKVFDSGWKLAGLLTGQVNAQELLLIDELWDWLDGTNPDFELADLIRRKNK
jgi:hypothetical protein